MFFKLNSSNNTALLNIVLWLGVATLIFNKNSAYLFLPYDGAYMRALVKFGNEWSSASLLTPLNPLQGLCDLSIPINFHLSPTLLLIKLLRLSADTTIVYSIISSAMLFASTYFLASSFPGWFRNKIIVCWLAVLFIMPVFVPHNQDTILGFYGISSISPNTVETITFTSLVVGCFVRASTIKSFYWKILYTTAGSLLFVWCIAFSPALAILASLPTFAFFAAGAVHEMTNASSCIKSRITNVLICCFAAVSICALPIVYMLTWPLATVAPFFADELKSGRPDLPFVSLLFHGFCRQGWMSSIIWVLAYVGSAHSLLFNKQVNKIWPAVYLVLSSALLVIGLYTTFVASNYRGISMMYFEWMLWPLMFSIACQFLFSLIPKRECATTKTIVKGTCTVGVGALLFYAIFLQKTERKADMVMPPVKTQLTSFLTTNIGLSPGAAFRGKSATFSSKFIHAPTSWSDQAALDSASWREYGFELRAITLWYYNIPTLFVYNQYVSPESYFITTRSLAKTTDEQQRSVIVVTQINVKMLEMLGVKYILSSEENLLPLSAVERTHKFETVKGLTERPIVITAYELKNTNVGHYSPVNIITASKLKDIQAHLLHPRFNPAHDVILDEYYNETLVQARHTELKYGDNKILVTSESSGTSLILLPVAFSHGLRIINRGSGCAKIVRANLAMVAVLFSGRLNATIENTFGPFSNVFAKVADARNFAERHEVASWTEPRE
jgi:hypothetical protein